MTNDIAVRVHKDSVVQDSIYGRRVRGLDVFLTVIIYTCAGFSILLLAGVVLTYQSIGTLGEWAYIGNFYKAVQDFRIGIPGMCLQVFGGYLFIKYLIRK